MRCLSCSKNIKSCKCSESIEIIAKLKNYNEQYPIFIPNFDNTINDYRARKFSAGENMEYFINITKLSTPYVVSIEPDALDIYIYGEFSVQVTYKNKIIANGKYNIDGNIPQNLTINLNVDNSFVQRSDDVDIIRISFQFFSECGIRHYILIDNSEGVATTEYIYCTVLRLLSYFTEDGNFFIKSVREICNTVVNYLNITPSLVLNPIVSFGQLKRNNDLRNLLYAIFRSEYVQGPDTSSLISLDYALDNIETLNRKINALTKFNDFDIEKVAKQNVSEIYSRKIMKLEKEVERLTNELQIKSNIKSLLNKNALST